MFCNVHNKKMFLPIHVAEKLDEMIRKCIPEPLQAGGIFIVSTTV